MAHKKAEIKQGQGSILIVDDQEVDRHLLARVLGEAGYDPWSATCGEEAVAVTKTALPDLVLLDVCMDEMDGYDTCRQLKARDSFRDVPVIFISALDDSEAKVRGFEAGAVDYITKPFHLQEVLARVETQLSVRRLQRQLTQANRELADHLDELTARNAELDAFAHTVAHDLKNPLQVILGLNEILMEDYGQKSGQLREMLSTISGVGHKMEEIISELLLLAELHKADIALHPLNMRPLIRGAQERLSNMIQEMGATIIEPETWPLALGYGPWIETVWTNYVSNAVKYGGRPPRVELGAEIVGGFVRFWVRDNGNGLTEAQQAKLFQPLQRLDVSQMEGQGLGLSIVRRIIERLDGQVGLKSQPGEGSEFSFFLPAVNQA